MYTQGEKLQGIINWKAAGETRSAQNFDDDWLMKVHDNYERFGSLTEKQETALDNIISRFHIDIEEHV